jgi:hypothetical protein
MLTRSSPERSASMLLRTLNALNRIKAGPSSGSSGYRLVRDRRGVTSLLFGVSAVAMVGLAGLATEGGTWYLEKRHGQNTADAAAVAGALALANFESDAASIADATNVAARNTYLSGTSNGVATSVAISKVTYNGLPGIRAVITRSPPRLFSSLFLTANVSISESALAVVQTSAGGNACTLALTGGLIFGGSTAVNGSNCALASNKTGPNSIGFTGNKATVTDGVLVASGGCSNCGNSPGYLMYQPPTTNPFAAIYDPTTQTGLTMPTFSGSKCLTVPQVTGTSSAPTTLTPWTSSNQVAYCGTGGNGNGGTLATSTGNVLNFVPGTYFFQNASLSFNGGTVECTSCSPGGAGVTIILIGTSANKIGTISIGGSATVTLNAPAINSYNAAFNGVLFYMDKIAQPTNGSGNAPVSLTGNGNVSLTGGMYFPTVNVNYSGDVSSTNPSTACTELVGGSIDFTGNSSVNISGCSSDGTAVAKTQSVQLVQ